MFNPFIGPAILFVTFISRCHPGAFPRLCVPLMRTTANRTKKIDIMPRDIFYFTDPHSDQKGSKELKRSPIAQAG